MTTTSNASQGSSVKVGRNDPCPCGSSKKFKRCCGFNEPVVETPAAHPDTQGALGAAAQAIPGFDPSQMDPEWLMKMSQAFQRLPKGQMQKLQGLMQKAMSGKDVSREAEAFEKTLPVELQGLLGSAPIPDAVADADSAAAQAQGGPAEGDAGQPGKVNKMWRKLFKKS